MLTALVGTPLDWLALGTVFEFEENSILEERQPIKTLPDLTRKHHAVDIAITL